MIESNLGILLSIKYRMVISYSIDNILMRPSSASRPSSAMLHRKSTENRGKANSKAKKNQDVNSGFMRTWQNLKGDEYKIEKPCTVRLKTLGAIHAYRPGLLKECLASQSNIRKYGKAGQCNLNDIFAKTILALFRDWREKINSKLTFIIDAVSASDQVMDPSLEQSCRGALTELKLYSIKLKQQIEEISTKGQDFKIQRLRDKYVLLLESIDHVLKLVDCMRSLSSEVETYLQSKKESGIKDSEVEVGVKAITEKYQRQATGSLNYCASHPDNQLLLRLEFKVRKMLLSSTQKVAAIFDSLRSLQQYQTNFKKQMLLLQNFEDFSHEYLGYVLQILYNKNEEIKIIEKKYQVSKMPEFTNLRNRIEDWQTNFIKRLRPKTITYLKQTLKLFNTTRTLHLIKNKGKEYNQLKKRFILLAKVYNQSEKQSNINAEYYQFQKKSVNDVISTLNSTVTALTIPLQEIPLHVQNLENIKEKAVPLPLKWVEKQCEAIENIQKTQRTIWTIANTAYLKLSRIQGINAEIIQQSAYTDKKCVDKLHQLVFYSKNEEQSIDIFKQLRSSPAKGVDIEAMLLSYDSLYHLHAQFVKNGLERGLERYRQLREILKEELITYLFGDQFKNQFISCFPIIKQLCQIEEKLINAAAKEYINGTLFYRYTPFLVEELRRKVNEEIKKLEQNRQKALLNKYIILIYEHSLIQLLNISQISRIFAAEENNLQSYRLIFHEYVQVYEGSLTKARREETSFCIITNKIYEICANLNEQNRLICEYTSSRNTSQYFPSCTLISQWLMCEFSAEVEQTISRSTSAMRRAQIKLIFAHLIRKMEVERQKMKLRNMKAQARHIYQHISANIDLLKQFDFAEDYQQLLIKLLNYLQFLQVPHCAIFTRDEKPICLLITTANNEQINQMLLTMLGITRQNKANSLLTPFSFKNTFLSAFPIESAKKKEPQTPIAQIKQDNEMMEEIVEHEEPIDQMVQQDLIQMIQSILPVNSVVQPSSSSPNPQKPSHSLHTLSEKNQTSAKLFSYFKLQQISDHSQLKNCLYYHNNQYLTIQNKLNIDLLRKALIPKKAHQSVKHIKDILEELRANDIIRLMNISDSIPDCEHRLLNFQTLVQTNDASIREEFLRLVDYFKIERKFIYLEKANYIESYRKENEVSCILHANLSENCYKVDLKTFKIQEIVGQIWNGITAGSQSFSFVQAQISQRINNTNALLTSYYEEIFQKIANFNQTHANRKEMEQQVRAFLHQIFNKRKLIDYNTGTNTNCKDLIDSITQLEKNLKEITIIQPFFTLHLDDRILFFDSMQISIKTISKCLLLPDFCEKINKCINYDRSGSPSIESSSLSRVILNATQSKLIGFGIISSFLDSFNKFVLQKDVDGINEKLKQLQSFKPYSKTFDQKLSQSLQKNQQLLFKNKKLLQFLLQTDQNKVLRIERYCVNGEIDIVETGLRSNQVRYFDVCFLDKLINYLRDTGINFHQLRYKNMTIALLEKVEANLIAEKLSISTRSIPKLQQSISTSGNTHILTSLIITFRQIIPSFDDLDPNVHSLIKKHLNQSKIQSSQTKNSLTTKCYQIYQQGNCVQLEVEWPKEDIQITYVSPSSTFTFTLSSNNYYYYAQIQILSLRSHIINDYLQIVKKYQADIKQVQEEAHQQEIRRQGKLNELQRIKQERELEKLRAEEAKARLRFGIDELNRKNKEHQTAEKAKLRFIEESTLAKLKAGQAKHEKSQQQTLNDKINHLSNSNEHADDHSQDVLEFEVCLSDGQDERFEQGRHNDQYDIQYDYRTTLYQHIKQTYHALRKKKEIDAQSWLLHF